MRLPRLSVCSLLFVHGFKSIDLIPFFEIESNFLKFESGILYFCVVISYNLLEIFWILRCFAFALSFENFAVCFLFFFLAGVVSEKSEICDPESNHEDSEVNAIHAYAKFYVFLVLFLRASSGFSCGICFNKWRTTDWKVLQNLSCWLLKDRYKRKNFRSKCKS